MSANQVHRNLPKVSIVYSESSQSNDSKESENLAFYLSSCLINTGYASLFMVPSTKDGSLLEILPNQRKLSFCPPGQTKVIELPISDLQFSHWSILESSHIIIVTSHCCDNEIVSRKIIEATQTRKEVLIFSMQRGVRAATKLKQLLSSKSGITFIECVVGFGVIQHPRSLAYVSTVLHPKIAMVRLSSELQRIADGPVNLLEATNILLFYKKVLQTHSWGVMIFEHLYALNAVYGGTLLDTIRNYNCRRVLAAMVRETNTVLNIAARQGRWKPNMEQISWILSPALLEMILLLPWPLFYFCMVLTDLPCPDLPSPACADLAEGRNTMASTYIEELFVTARQLDCNTPICQAVFEKLNKMNDSKLGDRGNRTGSKQQFESLELSLTQFAAYTDSVNQFRIWTMRILILVSFLMAILFLVTE